MHDVRRHIYPIPKTTMIQRRQTMKQSGALTKFHLGIMIVMMLGTIGAAIHFIVDAVKAATLTDRCSNLTNVLLMAFVLSMLITGAVYLIQNFDKKAAKFYKAFMLLHVGVCALTVIVDLAFYTVTPLLIVICFLTAIKGCDLLLLTFGKDLGKQKTWILFYVILGLDAAALLLSIINMSQIGFDFSFTGYVTALIADGTIGLSIRGKYKNKEARGSH